MCAVFGEEQLDWFRSFLEKSIRTNICNLVLLARRLFSRPRVAHPRLFVMNESVVASFVPQLLAACLLLRQPHVHL